MLRNKQEPSVSSKVIRTHLTSCWCAGTERQIETLPNTSSKTCLCVGPHDLNLRAEALQLAQRLVTHVAAQLPKRHHPVIPERQSLRTANPKVDQRLVLNQNFPRKARMECPMLHHLLCASRQNEKVVIAIAAANGHLKRAIARLMRKSCLIGRCMSPAKDDGFEGADFLAVLYEAA
mmetsp:Transcript_125516/g.198920  ORF Transcript_125516/g.198920 Transcript_125516/m.198920 type:complete len:177 (+) Transcript_125516:289-819(+)